MNKYVIFTDSGCDIAPALLAEWGVSYRNLTFRFQESEVEYTGDDMDAKTFYDKMREGGVAKTAAINIGIFSEAFEPILKKGQDILYLGFSSGLSTTYNSARLAAEQLKESYPDRKIVTVDTLAASAGEGLLLWYAVEKQKSGATLEENAEYVKGLIPSLCHWFTVDDLVYLKRGGRISPTAAFVGNVLGIKPVLHVDNEGHLINMFKVRGRRSAVTALADKYTESALDPEGGVVFISHADCEGDVQALSKTLKDRHGVDVKIVSNVGPVIGAHSGPGTLALFFLGNAR